MYISIYIGTRLEVTVRVPGTQITYMHIYIARHHRYIRILRHYDEGLWISRLLRCDFQRSQCSGWGMGTVQLVFNSPEYLNP